MGKLFVKTLLLVSCLVISVLAHIILLYALQLFGTYDFTAPVNRPQAVVIDLAAPSDAASPAVRPDKPVNSDTVLIGEHAIAEKSPVQAKANNTSTPSENPEKRQPESLPKETPPLCEEKTDPSTRINEAANARTPEKAPPPGIAGSIPPPARLAKEFQEIKNEKLTYLISMLGIPVGSAELEAINVKGTIWLTLRVRSNAAISSIFPVDNLVETRHIDGQFILTRIKQQEGSFKSDTEFTINLRKKRVTWIDHISNRSLNVTVPTDEVLDTLSGIYFLRNRQLHIGKTEALHIYDSETYADVPVEILRKESLRLLNLTTIDTVVVRPLQQTAGIFRRTGELLIWMTDDDNKVPVKIVTTIALGTVTAELLSAEAKPPEESSDAISR
jgi:hypothetical protein